MMQRSGFVQDAIRRFFAGVKVRSRSTEGSSPGTASNKHILTMKSEKVSHKRIMVSSPRITYLSFGLP
jgi:hypothetical protein